MGLDASVDQGIISPYTSRTLKPFIRYATRPYLLHEAHHMQPYTPNMVKDSCDNLTYDINL